MNELLWLGLAGGAALLVLVYGIAQYNHLIALRNHIRDAWANIDAELRRRYDLVPNLVATVRGYAAHEQTVLERVVELRALCVKASSRTGAGMELEQKLGGALQSMVALAEAYPVLRADEQFSRLHRELVQTEDRIQAARRFYNGNIRDYRNKCESFPSNLVARASGFGEERYFEVESSAREVPRVA